MSKLNGKLVCSLMHVKKGRIDVPQACSEHWRAQNTDLTTSKTKTFILNEIEIHFLIKDNIFHIIICNSNYISMHKNKKKETAGLVRHKVYWTEAKITGLRPAVQREIRALQMPVKTVTGKSKPFLH